MAILSRKRIYFFILHLFLIHAHFWVQLAESVEYVIDDSNYYQTESSPVEHTVNKSGKTMPNISLNISNIFKKPTSPNVSQIVSDNFHFYNSPCNFRNQIVDCSRLSLGKIQPSWFPISSETILFNDNFLKVLPNSTFSHLPNLTRLDLSNNLIDRIYIDAFKGLQSLKRLSLYGNKINFTCQSKLKYTFHPLLSLEELNLMQNKDVDIGIYTITFLEHLLNLEKLSTDFDLETLYFGTKFGLINNLTYLMLSGDFLYINSSSFENVAHLKELHFERLYKIYNISKDALKPFNDLKVLTFSHVLLDVQYILSLFEPLQGKNMTEISFDATSSSFLMIDPGRDGYLRSKDTSFLMNICLQTFTLNDCLIFYITPDAVQKVITWDKCLTQLTISQNPINGNFLALSRILRFKNLRKLEFLDRSRPCFDLPIFPRQMMKNPLLDGYNKNSLTRWKSKQIQGKHINRSRSSYPTNEKLEVFPIKNQSFTMSESINFLNFRRFVTSDSMDIHLTLYGAQNVYYLDLSYSGYHNFVGIYEGLTSLQTIILSGNDVSVLSDSFFDTFPKLKNLGLSNCRLRRDFMSFHSGRLFKTLSHLEQIDLSSNSLNFLSKDIFLNNPSLKYLNLSGNQFRNIPFSLGNTPELQILDLRENSITTIDVGTMRELDLLVSRTGNLQLYLDGNVLSCGCNDLEFLQWMRSSSITFDQNGNFTCINKEGKRSYTLKYNELDFLWRECCGDVFFYISLIMVSLYAIGVFIVFILLKNKYFVMSYFLQIFGGFKLHTRQDYPIGVYMGYSDRDYQFPCHVLRHFIENSLHLNTFINDRDLIASVDKASGIVNAINSSWRILLVCTKSFLLDDEWSMFTIRSAIYTQSPTNLSRVVVLVHESCLPLLPPELLSSVNDENILVVSDWTMNYKMTQMLKTRF